MGKIRGTHTSPGIYTQFEDLSYAAKTLGITTAGLVGETLKGRAFEPTMVSSWEGYKSKFGSTSAEKFKGTQYPKYELGYIAKEYLKKSDQLYVCRVLGLSGYNAGPAFVITAQKGKTGEKHVIAVLRSRGHYVKYANDGDSCNPSKKYDQLVFDCKSVKLGKFTTVSVQVNCEGLSATSTTDTEIAVNPNNFGQFTIICTNNDGTETVYPVSLNAGTKEYIYNVIGSDPVKGDASVFVEELYDVALAELIANGTVDNINTTVETMDALEISAVTTPVNDIVSLPYTQLSRKYIAKSFICDEAGDNTNGFKYYESDINGNVTGSTIRNMEVGGIYKVASRRTTGGTTEYVYTDVKIESETSNTGDTGSTVTSVVPAKVSAIVKTTSGSTVSAVKVIAYDSYFCLSSTGSSIQTITSLDDMSDYHEEYRCASTPWIVSELKSTGKNLEVKKLFRFHTISDGNCANQEVKISIANVCPDEGTFDVYIRDYNDTDASVKILESYKGLNMVPGNSKYIGLKIGTIDGAYPSKSNYVLVEVVENDMTETCVPCGFLGYPVRQYPNLKSPAFTYNTTYNSSDFPNPKKHYFGLSDITGVDVDMLSYKGKNAYSETYTLGYTNSFHLDSTLSPEIRKTISMTVTVDGDASTSGITWSTVDPASGDLDETFPVMGSESDMENTIFANKKLRKFTVYPCGGFDGWDIYRTSRTNTDDFKSTNYKGSIVNGYGKTFSSVSNGDIYDLPSNAITSDYYAYLAGYNQFENPEMYLINLFATPGIDYVNNQSLVQEVFDLIEDKRQDSLYITTTPDKPAGASDSVDEMYTSEDAAENLEDSMIDSYYGATYYPWEKYFDSENQIYINLPPTKDVLRNMADVDNKLYPWYSPAGTERGTVNCHSMHKFTKIDDEDNVYSARINPLKKFSKEGVVIWGNKTMYTGDTPMNRINTVRLMLYLRKLINESSRHLIFDLNDTTLQKQFEDELKPILKDIKQNRGITDFDLKTSQTTEQMDEHELSARLKVKPTPTLEYIEIGFVVTPQGVSFDDI